MIGNLPPVVHVSRMSHAVKNAKPTIDTTNPISITCTVDLLGRAAGRSVPVDPTGRHPLGHHSIHLCGHRGTADRGDGLTAPAGRFRCRQGGGGPRGGRDRGARVLGPRSDRTRQRRCRVRRRSTPPREVRGGGLERTEDSLGGRSVRCGPGCVDVDGTAAPSALPVGERDCALCRGMQEVGDMRDEFEGRPRAGCSPVSECVVELFQGPVPAEELPIPAGNRHQRDEAVVSGATGGTRTDAIRSGGTRDRGSVRASPQLRGRIERSGCAHAAICRGNGFDVARLVVGARGVRRSSRVECEC